MDPSVQKALRVDNSGCGSSNSGDFGSSYVCLSMKITLQVNSSPYSSNAGLCAIRYIETAIQRQHEILRVFFYREGIYHAFRFSAPPDDEINITHRWTELATTYQLDLVVCISAAQRRGLLSADEARRCGKQDDDLASGFRIGGLGQLLDAMISSDRYLEFG